MKFTPILLRGAFVIEQEPINDERGYVSRTFCAFTFRERGQQDTFVQANHSKTFRKGTIRGLHYQVPPCAEVKLIRCVRGSIQDVIVDVRAGSPTFLHWHSEILTDSNFKMIYVPEGFAHGTQTLEDNVEITYQSSTIYSPQHERGIHFNDPMIGIKWLVPQAIVSQKDGSWPFLNGQFEGVLL